tara:strand:- start:44790 stop:45341 length:552 start_codon:yes stop_codon:yes gene_type:complete
LKTTQQTYIALLRGINVGGHKKIKMTDLKASLEKLSFNKVTTYIQSGNVVFNASVGSVTALETRIQNQIANDFGFEVPVIIKTPVELKTVYANNPFSKNPLNDEKLFYVVFLKQQPQQEFIAHLESYNYSPEAYIINEKIVYFYAANGAANAKMGNAFFESKLKIIATSRNWRTLHKLIELSH